MASLEQTFSMTLQNTRLSLSEAGKGEPVLCLHGNPGSKNTFSELMTRLEDTDIRLLALDRPGHNSSEELLGGENDLWHEANLYSELIDKKLGEKAWLLGHSYGCLTAVKVALKHPEKVRGLILINPLIFPNNLKESCSLIPSLAKNAFIGTILGVWLPNEYNAIFGELLKKIYSPQIPSEDYLEHWLQKFTRFESIIAYLTDKNTQIKLREELEEKLKSLSLPTFALLGGADALVNKDQQEKAINLIPSSKLELFQEAGHYMPVLNPDKCIDFIKKCLA